MHDIKIDHQRLRHGRAAKLLRRAVYSLLVERRGWPLEFEHPRTGDGYTLAPSPHIYVHIPFCRSICPHCPYNKTVYNKTDCQHYGSALLDEIENYLQKGDVVPVESLYIGGGTPTVTLDLVETVVQRFRPMLVADAEIAIEVHPTDASPRLLRQMRSAGINKISLGIETFRSDLLKTLGRTYSSGEAEQSIHDARAVGFNCLDINLIYGIPGQDPIDPARDAGRVIDLGADQVSAYPLFSFDHTPLGKSEAGDLSGNHGERARLRSQKNVSAVCRRKGLVRTSVWSFTKKGVKPYTTVTRDSYRGFGAGAGSKVAGVFSFNTFSVDAYSSLRAHQPALVLHASERVRRFHWLYWEVYRTEIRPHEYARLFGGNVERDFRLTFLLLRMLGWIKRQDDVWRLSESGADWSHRLQSLFSLTYIDTLWQACMDEAWPERVLLD